MILRNMMMSLGKRGLLDEFQGSSAAYSTRALTSNLALPILRVRRGSDNVQQDFAAALDGNLDGAAILAFCGASEGRVVTWYDQSGGNNHATQTDDISRPQIVNNGFLMEINGKPAINFVPSHRTWLKNTTFNMNTNPHTLFSVADYSQTDANLRRFLSLQRTNSGEGNWIYGSSSGGTFAGSRLPTNATVGSLPVPTGQDIMYYMTNSTNFQQMGTGGGFAFSETSTITHADMQQLRIGQGTSDTDDTLWRGMIQELILYPEDRSADRAAIEQNQIDYWGII